MSVQNLVSVTKLGWTFTKFGTEVFLLFTMLEFHEDQHTESHTLLWGINKLRKSKFIVRFG